jgi:hypothetical protein
MWLAPRLFARQLSSNRPLQQARGCVFCVAWSVPKVYKGQQRPFWSQSSFERQPASQDVSLESEELNRGIEASELLSAG